MRAELRLARSGVREEGAGEQRASVGGQRADVDIVGVVPRDEALSPK